MQGHDAYPDPSASSPGAHDNGTTATTVDTSVSALKAYIPPNVPHGLPHVVRYATLSSMDLPLEVRFLIIMIARFADVHGVASVANSTLGEICRIGSHHTVERWISLASDVGILRKEPGKGGKDRKSNSYTFLGADRGWAPLPVGQPDINPIVALAQARRIIEELQVKAARVEELEAELALLRNGHTNGHSGVTNGEDEPPARPPGDGYETADSRTSQETHGAIGHSGVTNGSPENPPEEDSRSYETADSGTFQGTRGAIGHYGVTNGSAEDPSYEPGDSHVSPGSHGAIGHSTVTDGEGARAPEFPSHSYENADSNPDTGAHEAIGHSGVTDGSEENHPEESSNSYEAPASDPPAEAQEATGHSGVTNGEDEGQQYLSRRARVEPVVLEHRDFYQQSFDRRGVLGAIEFFSRSAENEQELMRQVDILEAGGNPRQSGSDPPTGSAAQPRAQQDQDRYAVGQCPDCGRPFGTYGGATHCTDCTERRRRESEA